MEVNPGDTSISNDGGVTASEASASSDEIVSANGISASDNGVQLGGTNISSDASQNGQTVTQE